ncbi:MAG TPA: acyl-CoA dehydrogenase family protein [Dehalococcoidia bacterium]|nr:acyl-CoA dehydrogenase family protein [Dehalococcoidia bacterium]
MEFEIAYTPEQETFRKEVKSWLKENVPPGIVEAPGEDPPEIWEAKRELGRRLGAKGWLWPTMPKQYGGGGLSGDHAIIIEEELDALDLTARDYGDAGGSTGAPSILVWATEEQKQAFLKPMLTGEWASWQLLTEPEAGSDLASVKTLAVRDGDDWVINGHKTFISGGRDVDMFWTICMTDPKAARHENTSWFVIPAKSPGLTIMRLDLLGGQGTGHQNSIFLDNVRVPSFNLVGGENQGWKVATTHLEMEHAGGGSVSRNRFEERIFEYCKTTKVDGQPISKDRDSRDLMMEMHLDAEINRLFGLRNFYLAHANKPRTYGGSQASYVRKMSGLRLTNTMGKLLGYSALVSEGPYAAANGYGEAQQRQGIISVHPAGTPDIQKLIISRRIGIGRTAREEAGRLE